MRFLIIEEDFPQQKACMLTMSRDLKIYDAAARRRAFITKNIFIEDNSHE